MKNFLQILLLIALITVCYLYRDDITKIWQRSFNQFFPCKQPITYSIGTFDTRFGISKESFLNYIKTAEDIWEKPINKNLFKYSTNGNLKINLIYDQRQKVTTEIKNIGYVVNSSRESYDVLVIKYKSLVATHSQNSLIFDSKLNAYNTRKRSYELEVSQLNKSGGANRATVDRLNNERNYLNAEVKNINVLQENLNNEVKEINTLVSDINQKAKVLNINVDKINSVGETLGGEFNEGLYKSSSKGEEIDIYQFDDSTKLIRVLAHELGHSLGLDHVEDSKAIMYRLNNGINEKLDENDLSAIKAKCGIK